MAISTQRYDAIVVGGGPSGSAAAQCLAAAGAEVLILDKAVFPRSKLCAGVVTAKTVEALERIFDVDPSALSTHGALRTATPRYRIVSRERLLLQGAAAAPFRLVDRERFDHLLLRRAETTGAQCRTGIPVERVDPKRGEVVLASGQTYRARVVIGADGVHSRVRRSLSPQLQSKRYWRRNLAHCVEIVVPMAEMTHCHLALGLHLGYVRHGYAWSFPRDTDVILGMCALPRTDERLDRAFALFLHDVGYTGSAPFKGHPLPYGNFLDTPAQERVLLTGDAAGLADPLLGEGLYFALRSGELAAQAALSPEQGFFAYDKALHSEIYSDFCWAQRLRRLSMLLLPVASGRLLGALGRMARRPLEEMVHGYRRYSGRRNKAGYS
ncbi:MAG: geranylgeranyl reductase family protein [Thermodesulfobacteriota bacterium]